MNEFSLTEKQLEEKIQAEALKVVSVSHEKLATKDEVQAMQDETKKATDYAKTLNDQIADIKAEFGKVGSMQKIVSELQAEQRSKTRKVSTEDANIIRAIMIKSSPRMSLEQQKWADDVLKEAKANVNNATTSGEGGYAVPTAVNESIISYQMESSILMRDANIVPTPTGNGKFDFVIDLEGTSVSYPGESTAANASKLAFGLLRLTPYRRITKAILSRELLDESRPDMLAHGLRSLAIANAKDTDKQGFEGTGTPMSGLFVNSSGASTYIALAASGAFKEATDAAMVLKAKAVQAAIEDVDDSSLKWYMARSVWWNSFLALASSTGDGIQGISDGLSLANKMLLGAPVQILGSHCANKYSEAASSLPFALLADLKQCIWLGNFGIKKIEMTDQATVKDNAGTARNLWDEGMAAIKIEDYFCGNSPDLSTLAKYPGCRFLAGA